MDDERREGRGASHVGNLGLKVEAEEHLGEDMLKGCLLSLTLRGQTLDGVCNSGGSYVRRNDGRQDVGERTAPHQIKFGAGYLYEPKNLISRRECSMNSRDRREPMARCACT